VSQPRMKRFQYWCCWLLMLALDWIPGYCRYYTLAPGRSPRRWQRNWAWERHALWGLRVAGRLGLIDPFVDECERRGGQRNRSSAS
jgi:hypothetical protein